MRSASDSEFSFRRFESCAGTKVVTESQNHRMPTAENREMIQTVSRWPAQSGSGCQSGPCTFRHRHKGPFYDPCHPSHRSFYPTIDTQNFETSDSYRPQSGGSAKVMVLSSTSPNSRAVEPIDSSPSYEGLDPERSIPLVAESSVTFQFISSFRAVSRSVLAPLSAPRPPTMLRQTARALKGLAEVRPSQQRALTTAQRATSVAARRNSPSNVRNQSTTAAAKPTVT